MNRFDCGAQRCPTGWIAYYRMVHHSQNFVLREGKHDIIFASKQEAEQAAYMAFLTYLNSPISGLTGPASSNWENANAAFNLPATTRPATIKQKGRTRAIPVVRKGRAS